MTVIAKKKVSILTSILRSGYRLLVNFTNFCAYSVSKKTKINEKVRSLTSTQFYKKVEVRLEDIGEVRLQTDKNHAGFIGKKMSKNGSVCSLTSTFFRSIFDLFLICEIVGNSCSVNAKQY